MFLCPKPLHPETARHIGRFSTRNDAHIGDLDLLIRGLISDGVWGLLDVLCVAGPTDPESLLDLKGNQDSAKVGAPAFVADAGYTTVSTTAIINTQFSLPPTSYQNQTVGVYVQNNMAGVSAGMLAEMYLSGGTYRLTGVLDSGGSSAFSYCSENFTTGIAYPAQLNGFFASSRVGPGQVVGAANGQIYVANVLSQSYGDEADHYPLRVGALVQAGSVTGAAPNEYSSWFIGQGMTVAQLGALRTHLQAYFTRRGTAV